MVDPLTLGGRPSSGIHRFRGRPGTTTVMLLGTAIKPGLIAPTAMAVHHAFQHLRRRRGSRSLTGHRSLEVLTIAAEGMLAMNLSNQLTYPGIGTAVLAQQLGLPVPSMVLLITVGALAAQGEGELHIWRVVLAGVTGCLLADSFWFWLGRRWGSGVIRLVCSFTSDPQKSRQNSHRIFQRWGLRLLTVAKFIPGLDSVAPPLAGAEGSTISGFLAYDAVGSLLWTSTYVLVGFLFTNQVAGAMRVVGRFGTIAAIVVGAPLLLYVAWRALRMGSMIKHLRLRRISPALLQSKLDDAAKVMIVDLLDYEAQDNKVKGIPGAFRADPARLRGVKKLVVPEDVEIVLYCSSKNEFVSARVADALQKREVHNVWVLEGGLAAWGREGRPVTTELTTGEQVAARMGIELPPDLKAGSNKPLKLRRRYS
jgi:membrane protein DedA with SNARE-associated domain/rhodanese-related sulfurtransferase